MKRLTAIALISALVLALLAGCNSSSDEGEGAGGNAGGEGSSTQVIRVGVPVNMKPYGYLDENEELQGFEVEFLREMESRLDGITFEITASGLTDLVLSLESGKLDLISYQLGKNEEREEKFLFAGEGYVTSGMKVIVHGDNTDINGLDDLRGKVLSMNPTEVSNTIIESYNEEHAENPILINYRDANTDPATLVATGKVDAFLSQPVNAELIRKDTNLNIKAVGDYINGNNYVYQMWRKDERLAEVIAAFDEGIRAMREDGTLKQLTIDILGDDYS